MYCKPIAEVCKTLLLLFIDFFLLFTRLIGGAQKLADFSPPHFLMAGAEVLRYNLYSGSMHDGAVVFGSRR